LPEELNQSTLESDCVFFPVVCHTGYCRVKYRSQPTLTLMKFQVLRDVMLCRCPVKWWELLIQWLIITLQWTWIFSSTCMRTSDLLLINGI